MFGLKLDLDPTLQKVVLVAVLLMSELILIKLIEILSAGRSPTLEEVALILCLGLLQLVTYLLAFLKKEET